MRRARFAVSLFLLSLASWGAGRLPAAQPPARDPDLFVLYTMDTRGFLQSCG